MSSIVNFSGANLPAVATLSTALRKLEAEVGPSGVAILKMDRTGHWVFGADQTEVDAESTWAVNPYSFVHGYIAWGEGEVLGEKMVSVADPLPEMDDAPPAARQGWQKQLGVSLRCVNGDDKGTDCRFSTTSVGGLKAIQALGAEIAAQVDKDPTKPVAIVRLGKAHYQHKSYGRIYTPVFEIVEWVGMEGPQVEEETEEAAPARRRRAV